jgi:hypothetical protein
MKPRDSLDPTDVDRDLYDQASDYIDDETDYELDIQEQGLSNERILKYSVRQKLVFQQSYIDNMLLGF